MKQIFLVLILGFGACGGDGGPVDGLWTLSSVECDGTPGAFPPFALEVDDDAGSFTLNFAADCVATIEETYRYGDGTIEIIPQSVACEPSTGCEAAIGASCPALPPPVTYNYVESGDTLTFTKASVGPPADPCPAGAEVKFIMSLQ